MRLLQLSLKVPDGCDKASGNKENRQDDQASINDETELAEAPQVFCKKDHNEGSDNRSLQGGESSHHPHDKDHDDNVKAHDVRGEDEDIMAVEGPGNP